MGHSFFAYMARMKLIRRWGLMKSVSDENIAEHSAQVAQIAHAIALIKNRYFGGNINADRVATVALYHETSEVMTGDLPTPIKYYNEEIRSSYKDIEHTANERLIATLHEDFRADYRSIIEIDPNSDEHRLVKAADKISAYVKCVEELKSGNREFASAEKTLRAEVERLCSVMPEVAKFCELYLDAFSLTLDEME